MVLILMALLCDNDNLILNLLPKKVATLMKGGIL